MKARTGVYGNELLFVECKGTFALKLVEDSLERLSHCGRTIIFLLTKIEIYQSQKVKLDTNSHEKPTEIFHSHIESCYHHHQQQQVVPNMIDDNLVNTINKRDHEKISTPLD